MAWTYNSTLSTTRDKVRFLIGDTNTNRQLLEDSELDFIIAENPDHYMAAVYAIDAIMSHLARDVDRSAPGVSNTRSQQMTHYKDLKIALIKKANIYIAPSTVARDDDEDMVMSVGMHDYA